MSEEKTVHVLIRDFFGVVALAFTVFGFMALNSFSPTDPSFNKSVTGMNVINSGGMVGAYLADGLANIFGSGSFFLPVITAALGWVLIYVMRFTVGGIPDPREVAKNKKY